MTVTRSILLFVLAAIAEIGGAWLVWQGVREHRGWIWIGAGVIALGVYGFVATLQPDAHFGRILAAYGGIFVAGSLAWGMLVDGFRPDRYDVIGVPELAAEDTDQWTVGELAEIVGMVRSIAEVCDLEVVDEVLGSAPGFGLLDQGTLPFVGREIRITR